ncbi:MAG: hypothetical protein K0Q79_3032 [Flavipsychrobacter sp.]|jgi:hypothetical protein|nr:hypothetical protein [Flavipsychrobacter sp.]
MKCLTKGSKRCLKWLSAIFFIIQAYPCFSICYENDSITVAASTKYKKPAIVRLILGDNYRKDWQTPVKMPVFHLAKEMGGLTITKPAGGNQTKSLQMVTADSVEMALRTIDKDTRKVLPPILRYTFVRVLAQDIVSAAQPYAPLTVSVLSDALGIMPLSPKLFYVPHDSALGKHQKDFAGKVCFLEERKPLRPGTKSEDMEDLLESLKKENDIVISQKEMLRARLLDMVIGDWDRHQSQWRWGKYDSAGRTFYYCIPLDRDQAFFYSDGLHLKFLRLFTLQYLAGFDRKITNIRKLNAVARDVDLVFLNELAASDWHEVVGNVQHGLTDHIIDSAINQLPPEILAVRGNELKAKLKSRRDGLYPAAMEYYSYLAKRVSVIATERHEVFKVTNAGGNTRITVYNSNKKKERNIIYERIFDEVQTKTVYLVGVDDNDIIEIPEKLKINIEVLKAGKKKTDKHDLRQKVLNRLRKNK